MFGAVFTSQTDSGLCGAFVAIASYEPSHPDPHS